MLYKINYTKLIYFELLKIEYQILSNIEKKILLAQSCAEGKV